MLLHVDDIEAIELENYVWSQMTVRVLAPRAGTIGKSLALAIHSDRLSVAQSGKPVPCPNECGRMAIDTKGYPWGQDYYKTTDENSIYCPHCDGAEDVG